MNIASNPWSFVSTDPKTASPSASPNGFTLNADGTVTMTTGLAHGFTAGQEITVVGATNAAYNGFYYIIAVPTATTATLLPQFAIASGTAASGGGTAALNQYNANVRIEDMSWQNASAAGQLLDIRDRNGLVIWQATASGAGQQNRGKIFWVSGITLIQIQSGIVIVTIN